MNLEKLNTAAVDAAEDMLSQCCASARWVSALVEQRPFESTRAVYAAADAIWNSLDDIDYLQAFDGHPRIGDISSLKARYADTRKLAAGEQSAVAHASDQLISALALGNREYEARFGFTFIVCATGKSADELLSLLQERLANTYAQEIKNAAEEQRKIFQLRLRKLA